jgi:hypothetical protein
MAASSLFHLGEIADGSVSGGPSTSQTIMVESLQQLLEAVPRDARAADYQLAVMDENVLGRQTSRAREWTFRQLRRYYGLNPEILLFRALRDLWDDDVRGQPVLALLCALARDPVLRSTTDVILEAAVGDALEPVDFRRAIEATFPGAYGEKTLKTTAANVASSWYQAGFLEKAGRTERFRSEPAITAGDLAYALLLGHLQDVRGALLFETAWAGILDRPTSRLTDLAALASQQGLIEFKQSGGVVEVGFSVLLRPIDDNRLDLL